ncbi:putative transposase [Salinibacter ruber]|uniref:IS5 family transposase n=1 Tax=Salinibacter ruber TaxID=146919 RepID=UPI00216901FD|nr:IS5 family transposase [Salinibacter ruber]MCS3940298.1 putative transposase [Salinibacter ruber]
MSSRYPSDLTDAEWERIEPIFDRFRFDEHDPRELINAVFYLVKSGCQWRMLPEEFPPWQTVYYHFRKWRELNLLQRLCDRIRRAARVAAGRDPSPSAAVIDTQSARAERQGGPDRGRDPNKQVTGRKRHVIVDTLGLLLAVVVHSANENDAQSAPSVLKQLLGKVPRLKVIFADKGYKGLPGGMLWRCFHWLISVVEPDEDRSGFDPIPKRWVIERTFGWFGGYRRLIRDYERRPEMSEAMVRAAMIRLMVPRIT